MSSETTMQTEPFFYVSTEEERAAPSLPGMTVPGPLNNGSRSHSEKKVTEAYERGLREGETLVKANSEMELAAVRAGVGKALAGFDKEREEYFNRVEPEVVQLALAIAKKILHRESQIDPLLLTGLVHVALEKLDAGTRVRLRVGPSDIHFWNEYFARSGEGQLTPELVGDSSLQQGECAVETEVGSTQISLETQLKEIEQGFFDLLEQRPRTR